LIRRWLEKWVYVPEATFYLNHTVSLTTSIFGKGTIIFTPITCFVVNSNNVTLDGLQLISETASDTVTPYAIGAINYDSLTITNCTIVNARVQHISRDTMNYEGCVIANNYFKSNFGKQDFEKRQNDIIRLSGIVDAQICHNRIELNNVHRVMKIQESFGSPYPNSKELARLSPWNSRNIIIEDNVITGRTTSRKQVIDLFDGTAGVIIRNNYVDVRGFNSIVENKTGFTLPDSIYTTHIHHNILKNDHLILAFQGSHGILNPEKDTGVHQLIIHDNCLEGLDSFSSDRGLASIRFFDRVIFRDNELSFQNPPLDFVASFFSNDTLTISRNRFSGGALNLSITINNSDSLFFETDITSIEVDSNYFSNAYSSFFSASIVVRSLIDSIDGSHLSIRSNHFQVDTLCQLDALVKINKTKLDSMHISCNIIDTCLMGLKPVKLDNTSSFRQQIIKDNACSVESDSCLIKVHTTALNYLTNNSLIFYPNPAQNYTLIDNPTSEKVRLAIYTINGRQLVEQMSNSSQIQLLLTDLDIGMYFVYAYFERQEVWAMGKLIKI